MLRQTTAAMILSLSFPATGLAHDQFLAQRFGEWSVVHGHWAGGEDAYAPAKVTSAWALDARGGKLDVRIADRGTHAGLVPPEGAALLAADFYGGFRTKGADDKMVAKPKNEVEGAKMAIEAKTYLAAVIGKVETVAPIGLPLEIVLQAPPASVAPGDKMGVQVLLDGAPLPNIEIKSIIPGQAPLETDAEGRADYVTMNGTNMILASHASPHPEPEKADRLNQKTVLSFTVRPKREESPIGAASAPGN